MDKPIIRAKRRIGLSGPYRTVFVTKEDLEIIPLNSTNLIVEGSPYFDEDEDDGAYVLNPNVISKKDWIEKWGKVWDLYGDDSMIRSHIHSEKQPLNINICGSFGKGYGAIIVSARHIPVVGCSRVLSNEDSVSTLCARLKGVALGLKMALKYQMKRFYLHVPSMNLCDVILCSWDQNGSGLFGSKDHLRMRLRPEDKHDIEKIYPLIKNIISDLDFLRLNGMNFFAVQAVPSTSNKPAELLANLSSDRDMYFQEIVGNKELCEIFYEESVY